MLNKEIRDYVKYNTGKYSNKFISKKTNLKINNLCVLQNYTGITVSNSFFGFDYIKRKDFLKETGLGRDFFESIREKGIIITKIIGKFEIIELEELEKFQDYLNNWLTFEKIKKIFNKSRAYLFNYLKNIEKIMINKRTILYNKKEVLLLKEKYDNLINETYSIEEFSKLINYTASNIRKLISKGKITIINSEKIININCRKRIPKTELLKFQTV